MSTTQPLNLTQSFLLIAVADPGLHPEISHVAAATGRPVIDLSRHLSDTAESDAAPVAFARHVPRAAAVIVDHAGAQILTGPRAHDHIIMVVSDDTPIPWEDALACHAERVFLIPAQTAELLATLADVEDPPPVGARHAASHPVRAQGLAVAVSATGGGVGTSTFALALARHLAESGTSTTLLDGVDTSGGVDLLAGIEESGGARWPDLNFNIEGRVDASALRTALPTDKKGVAFLSAARATLADSFHITPETVAGVVSALKQAGGNVVLDCPLAQLWLRGELEANPVTRSIDHVVLVTTAQVRPVSAVATIIRRLSAAGIPHSLVLRHRDWSSLEKEEIERITASVVDAEIPTINRLARTAEVSGLPDQLPRELTRCAATIMERISA